jgi:hypothetical protein
MQDNIRVGVHTLGCFPPPTPRHPAQQPGYILIPACFLTLPSISRTVRNLVICVTAILLLLILCLVQQLVDGSYQPIWVSCQLEA